MKPFYQDDFATIYHGNCQNILPAIMGVGMVDLLLTDPPYGLKMNGGTWGLADDAAYQNWDSETIRDIQEVLQYGTYQVIWGGNYYVLPLARCWLSWFKPDAVPTMGHFELAWTNLDQPSKQISCSIAQTNPERNGHPTQKPLKVISWAIGQVPGTIKSILDPFMGSGTTLRAAKDRQIKSIGIELEEKYCEIAARRLQQEVFAL